MVCWRCLTGPRSVPEIGHHFIFACCIFCSSSLSLSVATTQAALSCHSLSPSPSLSPVSLCMSCVSDSVWQCHKKWKLRNWQKVSCIQCQLPVPYNSLVLSSFASLTNVRTDAYITASLSDSEEEGLEVEWDGGQPLATHPHRVCNRHAKIGGALKRSKPFNCQWRKVWESLRWPRARGAMGGGERRTAMRVLDA